MTQTQLFFKDALRVNNPAISVMYITYEDGDLKLYAYGAETLLNGDGEPEIITLARDVKNLLAAPLDEIDEAVTVDAVEEALLEDDEGNKQKARHYPDPCDGDEDLWDDQT